MPDLTINISGDAKDYENALDQAKSQTEALKDKLVTISLAAGAAFTALTADIYLSVKAFAESEAASNSLEQALQNQGIYSDALMESYKAQAKELEHLTGIDDDAIVKAQALMQGMIGNQVITKDLTKAVLDLSVAKHMDLDSTAQLIGKGIEGHVTALKRLGIEIDEHLTKEERTAKIIEIVNTQFGDQAAAANKGLGSIKGLKSAFQDFEEALGQRFAPVLVTIIHGLTSLLQTAERHEGLVDLLASVTAGAAVFTGLITTVAGATLGFIKFKEFMDVAKVSTEAMSIATKGLVGATGIGLLVIFLSEIYLNWSSIFPNMQKIYNAFVDNISALSGGLGKILSGVFHLDLNQIKEGMAQAKEAIVKGYDDITAVKEVQAQKEKKQEADKASAAKVRNDNEIAEERRKQAVLAAERDLELLKLHDASAVVIQLKTEELDTLKKIADDGNAKIRGALYAHLEEVRSVQDEANREGISKQNYLQQTLLTNNKAYNALDTAQKALFVKQNQTALVNSLETEKTVRNTYALAQVQEDIKRRNQFLADEAKFGTAYAAINQAMHSDIYQGTKSAFSDMAALTQSQHGALKAIGKAAAVANIVIKTAESAMNIYAGFSTIPFIGPALGIAGAAAAIAFGAEQAGNVMSAAEGGMVTGGVPNMDSVPALLMPGELVVPKQNFNEVIDAVSSNRSGGTSDNQEISANIILSLKDDLMDFIEARLVERSRLHISIQGA